MVAIRLVLLLILSVALEISGPLGPDVMEGLEASQEAARGSAHPRLRLDRHVDAAAKGDPDRTTAAYRPSAVAGNHQNRSVTGRLVRKLPPAACDSAPSPEDH
jgi:hypothetical protein